MAATSVATKEGGNNRWRSPAKITGPISFWWECKHIICWRLHNDHVFWQQQSTASHADEIVTTLPVGDLTTGGDNRLWPMAETISDIFYTGTTWSIWFIFCLTLIHVVCLSWNGIFVLICEWYACSVLVWWHEIHIFMLAIAKQEKKIIQGENKWKNL